MVPGNRGNDAYQFFKGRMSTRIRTDSVLWCLGCYAAFPEHQVANHSAEIKYLEEPRHLRGGRIMGVIQIIYVIAPQAGIFLCDQQDP